MLWLIIILIIFVYQNARLFSGNWQTTEEFSAAGTTIFMNLSGHTPWRTAVRVIFVSGKDTVIHDGYMYFYTYDPRGLLLFDSCGYVKTSFENEIFPKFLYYKYSPTGCLRLYKEKNYGDFVKIND